MTGTWILRSTANTAATTFVGSGLSLAVTVVVARALGPANKGAYDLMVASSALAALLLGFSLSSGVTYAVARGEAESSRIPLTGLFAALAIGSGTCALLILLRGPLALVGVVPAKASFEVVVGISVLGAVTFFASVTKAALVGGQRVILANNRELLGRVIGLAAAFAAASAGTPLAFLGALALGIGAGSLVQTFALRPEGLLDRAAAETIVRFSGPSFAANAMQLLNYRLDLFIVGFFGGPNDVGLYAVSGTLAQLVWVIPRAAATSLFPAVAGRQSASADLGPIPEAARLTTLLALTTAAALGVIALWLVPMAYGSRFQGSIDALWLLLPGVVALAPAAILAVHFLATGRPGINARISSVALVVTLVGDVVLIPRFGILGASVASSLSYGTTLIFTVAIVGRESGLGPKELLIPTWGDIHRLFHRIRRFYSADD